MLPSPNRARGLDIRQALDWLIFACGPRPAHGDILNSLLPQTLLRMSGFQCSHNLPPLPGQQGSRHPACALDSLGKSQTPVLSASFTAEDSCETPHWSRPNPLVRQEGPILPFTQTGEGAVWDLTAAPSREILPQIFLSTLTVGERLRSGFLLSPLGRFSRVDCFRTHSDI